MTRLHTRRTAGAALTTLTLMVALAGCGSSEDPQEPTTTDDDLATNTGPSEAELEAEAYEQGVTAFERISEMNPLSLDDIPMPPEAADYATDEHIDEIEQSMEGFLEEGWRIDDQTEILSHELVEFTPSTVQTPKGSMTIEFCLGGSSTVYDQNDEVVGEAGGDPIVSSVDYYQEQQVWKVRDSGQVEGKTCGDTTSE